MMDRRTESDES